MFGYPATYPRLPAAVVQGYNQESSIVFSDSKTLGKMVITQ